MERTFCDVDSLVLSQFSYLKFDGIVPDVDSGKAAVGISEIAEHADYEKLFSDERYREVNEELFQAVRQSRRFGTMKLNFYENIIDVNKETQFSAVTYLLEDGTVFIAFRGTDETIVGWKEDFNMTFMEPVTGQLISVKYLNHTAGKFAGPFLLGGHSKGGNFAVFAAMKCKEEIRMRIQRVYSHDGPGFRPEVLRSGEYEAIESRVCKILPHSSVVGMLLQHQENYEVVSCKKFGLMQHNPFNWVIQGEDFVRVKDIYYGRRLLDEAVNEWILSLPQEQLTFFVDTLFQIIEASEADNLIDMAAEWKKSAMGVLGALKELDADTAGMLKKILKSLFEIISHRVKQEFGNKKASL
ncbi:MAG: DUF2974 domain-containing protein [Clostridiales bacterium]|nr:DUF2974 domain-containing protein [Clostridiales bacterium]